MSQYHSYVNGHLRNLPSGKCLQNKLWKYTMLLLGKPPETIFTKRTTRQIEVLNGLTSFYILHFCILHVSIYRYILYIFVYKSYISIMYICIDNIYIYIMFTPPKCDWWTWAFRLMQSNYYQSKTAQLNIVYHHG